MNSDLLSEFMHDPGDLPAREIHPEKNPAEKSPEKNDEEELGEESTQQYLIFRITDKLFALEITTIREVARIPPIAELPRAPSDIVGVVSFRGEIVGIFDLHRHLGKGAQPEFGRKARLIVAQTEKGQAGIIVDGVEQVLRLKFSSNDSMQFAEPSPVQFFSGTVSHGNQKIPVLDLCEILSDNFKEAL